MPANTARLALPYPLPDDTVDVPRDVQALAAKLDPAASVFLQGTAAARPVAGVAGRIYYATDTGAVSYDTGTLWVAAAGAGSEPPYVTSLPASPYDGQEVYYADATMSNAGVAWHLRYRAAISDAYKWQFVGGADLADDRDGNVHCTSTSYIDLGDGPRLTTPLAGSYDIGIGASLLSGWANLAGYMSYQKGAAAASDADAIYNWQPNSSAPPSNSYMNVARWKRNVYTAGQVLLGVYRVTGVTALDAKDRWMRVRPVRVG